MAYKLDFGKLDFGNTIGVKKKKDDNQLLGDVAAQPEELANPPVGNIQPTSDPDFQLPQEGDAAVSADVANRPSVGEIAGGYGPDMDNLKQSAPGDRPPQDLSADYYTDDYIDPFIKQNVLQRENVNQRT